MLKKILITIAVVVAAVLIYAATKPDTFRVQRSVVIKTSPDKIAPFISDLHRWESWSPYEKLDPSMKRTFSGAAAGKGASYAWDGNDQVGTGRMEITDMSSSKIVFSLEFLRPFKSTNAAEFLLEPKDGGTEVTWAMYGPSTYVSKLLGTFCNMDKMVGKDFESGLTQLKKIVEK